MSIKTDLWTAEDTVALARRLAAADEAGVRVRDARVRIEARDGVYRTRIVRPGRLAVRTGWHGVPGAAYRTAAAHILYDVPLPAVIVHRNVAESGKMPVVVCGDPVDVQHDASWVDAYDADGIIRTPDYYGAEPDERITDHTHDLYSDRRIDDGVMPAWAAHCPDCWAE